MRRIKRKSLLLLLLLVLVLPVHAQFNGYSIPQTIALTPFNATACTGSPQTAAVPNLGQTEHFITVTTNGNVLAFRATVQGSHDGTTFNDISDVATNSGATVEGQGYYPITQVSVTCATAAGTFTVKYSGEATAPAPQFGAQASSQLDKTLAIAVPSNANFTTQQVRAPFGNSGGAIYFQYSGAGPSGSTLNVSCSTLQINSTVSLASFPLNTAATLQIFPVPLLPCDFATIAYTSGGASATTFTMSYVFVSQNITGGDPCQGSTVPKQGVSISLTASGQLLAALTGHAIYVCGYNFTLAGSATATAQLEYGTGATCGTGTVTLTGTMLGAATPVAIDSGGGGYTITKTAPSNALCLALGGGTPSAQGVISLIQQ